MLKTKSDLYRVHAKTNNHYWLEVLEGDDQGTRLSVPIHSSEYDEKTQAAVLALETGDVHDMVLVSESANPPQWRISKVDP